MPISKASDNDRNFEKIIRSQLTLAYKRYGITAAAAARCRQNDKCMNGMLGLILFSKHYIKVWRQNHVAV
jgi:hypothetical protein